MNIEPIAQNSLNKQLFNEMTNPALQTPELTIICPIFNEEENIELFYLRLMRVLEPLGVDFELLCINDGSVDSSNVELQKLRDKDKRVRVINLSRNFGKEAALTCGIDLAQGQAIIPIDIDMQDPPELIAEMLTVWRQGFDVVLMSRVDRSVDGVWKRNTASWFYRLHNAISEPPIPANVGDFRLMDRKVIEAIKLLPERHRFMKGLFAWVGFRQATIPYVREPRIAGSSKFPVWKLWNLALEGITSFSTAPLRIWTYLGSAIALTAFAFGLFIFGRTLLFGVDLPGYASIITIMLFLGGIQLMGLGVMGEYIGRIYIESKNRPVYVIREDAGVSNGT